MFIEASLNDVKEIHSLENMLFEENIRMSRASIVNSVKSNKQKVIIVREDDNLVGCMIIIEFKKSFRLYSLAVDPLYQGKGYGAKFMEHLLNLAKMNHKNIVLEVDKSKTHLLNFYKKYGFIVSHILKDYYGPNQDGLKMIYYTEQNVHIDNLIVTEKKIPFIDSNIGVKIVDANEYMSNEEYIHYRGRVFNLCDNYKYQSVGYYVSLLATARDNRVIPSVTTINDLKNKIILRSITDDIDNLMQEELKDFDIQRFSFRIYFGVTKDKKLRRLANELFLLFEVPFLEIELEKYQKWMINKANAIPKDMIKESDYEFVNNSAKKYFSLKRFKNTKLKNYIYDLAILINPDEKTPPSDQKALAQFKKAGEEIGFYVEFITKKDYRRITEFDALFIRETTNVNNHTYDFARYAYSEGLALVDDPWTILKCSNKVFLYERMKLHHVLMPETRVITSQNYKDATSKKMNFPIIIKQPDSSFSQGVFKVNNYTEYIEKVKNLLKVSQLIIAQEFIQSDFDWRIGILNNQVIYACKYHMAKGHWQILDWTNNSLVEGESQTFHINDVPSYIIETALKSTALIGNGLYGVDLKEFNNQAYLIEINDNPNIDYGYEDAVEQENLYKNIMQVLFERIDMERNLIRYI